MTTRISRDAYGIRLAQAAALRADCTRRQVGAVIVSPDGSIVATGYNGRASGLPGCLTEGACPRGRMTYDEQPAGVGYAETSCDAAHAEANAIIRAGRDRCVGATIYVTDLPCHGCLVLIAAAGIARTVTPDDLGMDEWDSTFRRPENPAAEIPPPALGPATHRRWADVRAERTASDEMKGWSGL